jgi:hypothetical protein
MALDKKLGDLLVIHAINRWETRRRLSGNARVSRAGDCSLVIANFSRDP